MSETSEQLPTEMSIDDAVAFASRMHRLGELDAAERLYRRVLEVVPTHPDALNFLGILCHQRGYSEEALRLMHASLASQANAVGVWNNIGNILLDLGRIDEAAQAYAHCVNLDASDAQVWNNLGVLRRAQGRLADAEAAYLRALDVDPKHIDAHNNLGNLLAGIGRIEEAVQCYCRTIALMPGNPAARKMLGYAYCMLGRLDEAAEYYRKWLEEEPDNPTARHHLAACTGAHIPTRAEDAYVESVFDGFADSFDAKLAALTYRAPELVADAVRSLHPVAGKQLDILDAGCGTGLCGPLLAAHARTLTGIDLSGPMLTKAQGRNVYDQLIKAELSSFLHEAPPSVYDLLVSADTLCYFGDLQTVFAGAFRTLRPGGSLIFTVELAEHIPEGAGYLLSPHGRYAHTLYYVTSALKAAGMEPVSAERQILRTEGGKPVNGLLQLARKPPGG